MLEKNYLDCRNYCFADYEKLVKIKTLFNVFRGKNSKRTKYCTCFAQALFDCFSVYQSTFERMRLIETKLERAKLILENMQLQVTKSILQIFKIFTLIKKD